MNDRIAKWAIYSFLLSLPPFALLRIVHLAQGTDPFYWYYLWQRGELALVGFTLATVGAGELVTAHLRRDIWTYLCGGCTLFAIAMGVTCFTCHEPQQCPHARANQRDVDYHVRGRFFRQPRLQSAGREVEPGQAEQGAFMSVVTIAITATVLGVISAVGAMTAALIGISRPRR